MPAHLHLVLVAARRGATTDRRRLAIICDGYSKIAAKKGHRLGAAAVLPERLHLALGPAVDRSPAEVALDFLNNLASPLGQTPHSSESYYVDTFSDYDIGAVRAWADGEASDLAR